MENKIKLFIFYPEPKPILDQPIPKQHLLLLNQKQHTTLCSVLNKLTQLKKVMRNSISNSLRLEIVDVYYHSSISKLDICKKYGISRTTLFRILRTFGPVNINRSMNKKTLPSSALSLSEMEEELLRLRLRVKELEGELYDAQMARDAYDCMIDLAEKRYHIRVRKNSDAK